MIIAVALSFSLISVYFKPNDKDLISLFGLLYPALYVIALLTIPFVYRRKKVTLIAIIGLLLYGLPKMLHYIKPGFGDSNPASDISVMTFNTMMGYGFVNSNKDVSPSRLEELKNMLSKEPKPDVLCLQEAGPHTIKVFDELNNYPYRHRLAPKGAVIYSNRPLLKKGLVEFKSKINSCLWADVLTATNDTVRVYSTHLESTRLSDDSYDLLSDDDNQYRAPFSGIKDLIMKYPRYAGKRANQALKVKKHINTSPYPVILSGDMNEPPMSYTYRILSEDLNDAFVESGVGIGNTWQGKIPMLRIDYIFASEELANTSYTCLRSDLSDHYPVKASYTIK